MWHMEMQNSMHPRSQVGVTYQAANDSAHVKDSPEPGKVLSLLALVRVRDHDGALRRPQKRSADTQPDSGKDVEARNMLVLRDKQTDGVETVANTSKSQRPPHSELVDKGASEEAKDGECRVQGRVLSRT